MFASILAAIDDSDPSDKAVELAVGVAKQFRARLTFCHAVDYVKVIALSGSTSAVPVDLVSTMREDASALLARAKAVADAAGVDAVTTTRDGSPVDEILQAAKECTAELIVIGTHGRRGLERLFLGSTAEGVLRRSDAPVLVVRA